MENWYFIDSGYRSPSYNMALDEKLMEWHHLGKIPPVLRFYEWDPPTLSVGYFQNVERDIDMDRLKEENIGFVRRPTGGRGVLHDDELTYSIVVSDKYPGIPETVTEAYRILSEGLLIGFRNLGLHAEFSIPRTEKEKAALKDHRSAVCFDASSWYELIVEGRKVAGSAQTRQKGIILQHGSILRTLDTELLFSLFKFKNDAIRERMKRQFASKAVSINELTDQLPSREEMKVAFKKGFEEGLKIKLVPYSLTEEEHKEVEKLANAKYKDEAWTSKRKTQPKKIHG